MNHKTKQKLWLDLGSAKIAINGFLHYSTELHDLAETKLKELEVLESQREPQPSPERLLRTNFSFQGKFDLTDEGKNFFQSLFRQRLVMKMPPEQMEAFRELPTKSVIILGAADGRGRYFQIKRRDYKHDRLIADEITSEKTA